MPAIEERKTVVNGLGVTIITVAILILEIGLETTKMLKVRTAQHEGSEEFVPDRRHGECAFDIQWIGRVCNEAVSSKFLDLHGEKNRHDSHHSNTAISFERLDMRNELPVKGVIVHPIFLVLGESFLVGGDSGHHPLSLGVIRAAKALHQLEEADHVLRTADCGECVRCFEVIF